MGAQSLPREYRADKSKANRILVVMGVMVVGIEIGAWSIDDLPVWAKLLISGLALSFVVVVAATLPRSGTTADRTGLQIHGPFRTRRLAWTEIEDIVTLPMKANGQPFAPEWVAYAYPTSGRRALLIHVNDLHLGSRHRLESEIGLLCAARDELGGAEPVPDGIAG
ncbi:hypothetical protein ACGFX4_12005 [Kitasatospora sp. NPDC048365]|uniref:hypothetical protein n=1 Tax=Kitasatospora sp. NPDC048365 TaxID=3364050 RepID=UPI00371C0D2B